MGLHVGILAFLVLMMGSPGGGDADVNDDANGGR
jgi:hypothetical protein